jgi:hypothetical protein
MQKFRYVRSKKLLEACREIPCQLCGAQDGTVVAAHSNQAKHGKGRGIKASDEFVAALLAAEREACADICDQYASIEGIAQLCAAAIRARGQS